MIFTELYLSHSETNTRCNVEYVFLHVLKMAAIIVMWLIYGNKECICQARKSVIYFDHAYIVYHKRF